MANSSASLMQSKQWGWSLPARVGERSEILFEQVLMHLFF